MRSAAELRAGPSTWHSRPQASPLQLTFLHLPSTVLCSSVVSHFCPCRWCSCCPNAHPFGPPDPPVFVFEKLAESFVWPHGAGSLPIVNPYLFCIAAARTCFYVQVEQHGFGLHESTSGWIFPNNIVSPLYPWVLHPWIQPSID